MNVVVLGGNLTSDPELRYTGTGTPVATMRLAVSGKDDEALFINVVAWERLADVCAERLRKGNKVVVHGRLQPESWTAKDGSKRSAISVRAASVEFMQTRGDADPTTEGVPPRADSEYEPEPTGLPF